MNSQTPTTARPINWFSVAAVLCLIAEAILLAHAKPATEAPPPVSVLILSLMTLFLGSGAIIYRVQERQHWFFGRWMGVGAMTAGMLLFAVQSVALHKAREMSQFRHIAAIGNACLQYAGRHQGHFPTNLLTLLDAKLITVRDLSDPTNALSPITLPAHWNRVKRAEQIAAINRNSDYRYTGADLTLPDNAKQGKLLGTIIILFRNTQTMTKGGPLGFADGHVTYYASSKLAAVLAACNKARHKLGLPPMSFGGIKKVKPSAGTHDN
jgi:hypothetical protein